MNDAGCGTKAKIAGQYNQIRDRWPLYTQEYTLYSYMTDTTAVTMKGTFSGIDNQNRSPKPKYEALFNFHNLLQN